MSDAQRLAVWADLKERLDQLTVSARLLPWTRDELRTWTLTTFLEAGTWVTGVPGAVAEFPCGPNRRLQITASDECLVARADYANFRLKLHDKLRAFAFGDGPIVIGLPKARASLASHEKFTALGHDQDAIDVSHQCDELFDFGIGRKSGRFVIRTADVKFAEAMHAQVGKHWSKVLHDAGALILSKSPHRVVESALARIEVFAKIPAPGETSPDGAHTHFLPSFLHSGDEAPAGLSLPDFGLPVAIYYPRREKI